MISSQPANINTESPFLLDRHPLLSDPQSINKIPSASVRNAILTATGQSSTRMSSGGVWAKVSWTKALS